MTRRGILFAVLALIFGGLLGLTAIIIRDVWPTGDSFAVAMANMRACSSQDNSIVCTRPVIQKLLETKDASEIMGALDTHFGPAQCHYIGHVVGQQAYIKNQSVELSLSQCSRACDSACVHGAIGEAFMEKLGLGSPEAEAGTDLKHLSSYELITVGRRLCTSPQVCHGVGHAVFQTTPDLPKAMSLCKNIMPPGGSACYNGAAMEYADVLASRNMRAVPGVQPPAIKSLDSICTDLSSTIERRSCFRYYPRMVIEAFKEGGYSEEEAYDEVAKICASYTSTVLRTACFSGIGSFNAYYVLKDQSKAIEACKDIPGERSQAACYFGEIAVAVEERQNKLIEYCGTLPDKKFQAPCYQWVFYYLNKFELPMDNAAQQCGGGNTLCEDGRKNYMLEPWTEMYKNFSD